MNTAERTSSVDYIQVYPEADARNLVLKSAADYLYGASLKDHRDAIDLLDGMRAGVDFAKIERIIDYLDENRVIGESGWEDIQDAIAIFLDIVQL